MHGLAANEINEMNGPRQIRLAYEELAAANRGALADRAAVFDFAKQKALWRRKERLATDWTGRESSSKPADVGVLSTRSSAGSNGKSFHLGNAGEEVFSRLETGLLE